MMQDTKKESAVARYKAEYQIETIHYHMVISSYRS